MNIYRGDFLGVCHSDRDFPISVRKYFRRYFCGVERKNFSVTEEKFETDLRKAVKQLLPEGFKLQNKNRNDSFFDGKVTLKVKTAQGRFITVSFTSLKRSETSWATCIVLERNDEYFSDSSCVTNLLELTKHLRLVDALWYRKSEIPDSLTKFIRPDLFGNGRHNLMCVRPRSCLRKMIHPACDKTRDFTDFRDAYQNNLGKFLPEGYTFKNFRISMDNAHCDWDIVGPDNKEVWCGFDYYYHSEFESFNWLCNIRVHLLGDVRTASLFSLADTIKSFEEV